MSQVRVGGRWLLLLACAACLLCCSTAKKNKQIPVNICYFPSSDNTTLLYYETSAQNSSSCMHYAWSTLSYPTLLVSQTSGSECNCSGLHYNETEFVDGQLAGSVGVPGSNGGSVVALIFTRLVEFSVDRNNADASNVFNATEADNLQSYNYSSTSLDSSNLTWSYFPANNTFRGVDNTTRTGNDTLPYAFSITHTIATEVGSPRLGYFPKTQFTENSTVFDLVIENPLYMLSYNRSRIALEVLVVHGPNVTNGSVNISKTLDDEYTPSVFKAFSYLFGSNGYFQWKPISYQSQTRQTTKAQQANMVYAPDDFVEEIPPSLASAVFGNDSHELNVTRWFMVIGTPKDQSYINSNYSTWSAVVGFGDVQFDQISFVIIITIIVGFGVPLVVVLFGGVYVFFKKKPWQNAARLFAKLSQRQTYSRLN